MLMMRELGIDAETSRFYATLLFLSGYDDRYRSEQSYKSAASKEGGGICV